MKAVFVSGVVAPKDAISASVVAKIEALKSIVTDEPLKVRVFTHSAERDPGVPVTVVKSVADVILHRDFLQADLIVYDFGIFSDLFDSIHVAPQGAAKLVHFHNITPAELVPESQRELIRKSHEQMANLLEADCVLVGSEYNRETAVAYGVAPERIASLNYVVEGAPVPRQDRSGPLHLLFVGRFVPSKGVLDLIDAMPRTARLTLCGNLSFSDKQYVDRVRARIAERGLEVTWKLDATDAERDALYGAADVLVMPSYHEGFCVPVVEAYRHGCDVIAYDAGNLRYVVGELGTLVKTGDKAQLSAALAHHRRSDAARRERMSAYAATFSQPQVVKSLQSILEDTVLRRSFPAHPMIKVLPDAELRQTRRTSLNRVIDISDFRAHEEPSNTIYELHEGGYIHRKSWEYAMCIFGLRQLGKIKPDAVALAVGAGYERPLYWFANNVGRMVATDLYDNPQHEGTPEMLKDKDRFAPFPYRKDHLEVRRMDGTNLDFPDNTFDIAFSLSSIEHFGPRSNSLKAVREIHRALKPGGVACLATELILNQSRHAEYFTFEELDEIFVRGTPMRLVGGDLDLRISRSLVENPIDLETEKLLNVSPHIVLKQGDVIFTSVILFLQKPS